MPINTNLNQAPYFDDFDQENQYYRVLFKPGFAVQARELTQLQTQLQNQVEQFGDNIFKEGRIVNVGSAAYILAANNFVEKDFQSSENYIPFVASSSKNELKENFIILYRHKMFLNHFFLCYIRDRFISDFEFYFDLQIWKLFQEPLFHFKKNRSPRVRTIFIIIRTNVWRGHSVCLVEQTSPINSFFLFDLSIL